MNLDETYTEKFLINNKVIDQFADLSRDFNPLHIDLNVAKEYGYSRQVAHGAIQLAYLSKIIGMNFPGKGSIWVSQNINWIAPVLLGDEITFHLSIKQFSESVMQVNLELKVFNQDDKLITKGNGVVKIAKNISFKNNSLDKNNYLNQLPKNKSNKKNSGNQVALVTGASRGIGSQVALDLAMNGFNVVINYVHDKGSADEVVDEINSNGGLAVAVQADIGVEKEVINLVKQVYSNFGSCDILVQGATPKIDTKDIEQITYMDVEKYLQVYLNGSINLVKHLLPKMKENKFGRLIFLGTAYLFETPPDGFSSYVIAKYALWGYVRSLSLSLGKFGITTNMISPSLTITDLTRDIPARVKEVESVKSPIRRLITTKDISHRITFLCSNQSGYENGKNIPITGGIL
jgi:3-oxoacyl-[acyl-carrier protein] reductase